MADRRLDPVTEDFVDGDGGGFETCDVIENKVAMSFKIPRGSWEGDPSLGHRFAELDRATNTSANRLRLEDLCRDAIKWLTDSGEISDVVVQVDDFGSDKVAFQVDYRIPGAGKNTKAGPFLIPVGAG